MTTKTTRAMATNKTTDPAEVRLDAGLRAFLRKARAGQCLAIAAWAAQILRAGRMTMADLERCLNLGFEF